MATIHQTLAWAKESLHLAGVPTPRLDAEVLLAHVLTVDRSWLHAHDNERLESLQVRTFERFVARRLKREPVAYITGKKEFYLRDFIVTPDVLIPRPETEDLVTLALTSVQDQTLRRVVDVGCGSGCVGITLKLERPAWDITLSDISVNALAVAQLNAKNLGANVTCVESDLLSSMHDPVHGMSLIVANLPYVDQAWQRSPETDYEPPLALFADNRGLRLIYQLIEQAPRVLCPGGLLLLEADPEQHPAISHYAKTRGFMPEKSLGYALSFVLQP